MGWVKDVSAEMDKLDVPLIQVRDSIMKGGAQAVYHKSLWSLVSRICGVCVCVWLFIHVFVSVYERLTTSLVAQQYCKGHYSYEC